MLFGYKCSFLAVVFFCFLQTTCFAQDNAPITFGKVSNSDFEIKSTLIDENCSAVIVADIGNTSFEGNAKGWFSYVYKRRRRIKILNKKSFELGTIGIFLYQNKDSKEVVSSLVAHTYNIQNGTVVQTTLNSNDVYDEKVDKNHFYKKFTMPSVKEGSIIEYSYTIKSDFLFNLPSWEFQSTQCPTLWTEYNVVIPGLLSYMSSFQGYHPFLINKASEGYQDYDVKTSHATNSLIGDQERRLTVSAVTTKHRWVMKDLPMFNKENFIFSSNNFIDKISFQLYKTYDGESHHDVANSWKKLSEELMNRDDFGEPLTQNNDWLDKILETDVAASADMLQTAKNIYYYVQNNYTCTNHYNTFIKTTLSDVVKKKSGTVGEINLLLVALLLKKGIGATPVIMSTRDFGYNNPAFPFMERLNYVVCAIHINGADIFVDATKPFLAFGKLPLECYNGHARKISTDTTALDFSATSITETDLVNVIIFNNDKGQVDGGFSKVMGFYQSLNTKNDIAKTSVADYYKRIEDIYPPEYSISNITLDSFTTADGLITERFDFILNSFSNNDIVYFNPLMGQELQANPFTASQRIYPVEMPYQQEAVYSLNMEIPKNYTVEELPKSCKIKLNEDEGFFEYLVNSDSKYIQFRRRMVLNKTNFTSNDYQTLRDFYAFVVKKEAEQIVFKKIK